MISSVKNIYDIKKVIKTSLLITSVLFTCNMNENPSIHLLGGL